MSFFTVLKTSCGLGKAQSKRAENFPENQMARDFYNFPGLRMPGLGSRVSYFGSYCSAPALRQQAVCLGASLDLEIQQPPDPPLLQKQWTFQAWGIVPAD